MADTERLITSPEKLRLVFHSACNSRQSKGIRYTIGSYCNLPRCNSINSLTKAVRNWDSPNMMTLDNMTTLQVQWQINTIMFFSAVT